MGIGTRQVSKQLKTLQNVARMSRRAVNDASKLHDLLAEIAHSKSDGSITSHQVVTLVDGLCDTRMDEIASAMSTLNNDFVGDLDLEITHNHVPSILDCGLTAMSNGRLVPTK